MIISSLHVRTVKFKMFTLIVKLRELPIFLILQRINTVTLITCRPLFCMESNVDISVWHSDTWNYAIVFCRWQKHWVIQILSIDDKCEFLSIIKFCTYSIYSLRSQKGWKVKPQDSVVRSNSPNWTLTHKKQYFWWGICQLLVQMFLWIRSINAWHLGTLWIISSLYFFYYILLALSNSRFPHW